MAVDTLVTGSKLTAIANAIRTICDSDSTYTLDEMPSAILEGGGGGGGGSFDWTKVQSLQYMFADFYDPSVTTLDVSGISGLNAKNLSYMFYRALISDVTGLDVLNMTGTGTTAVDASYMIAYSRMEMPNFYGATWRNIYYKANLSSFAYQCSYLTAIKMPTIVLAGSAQGVTFSNAFAYCSKLESLYLADTVQLENVTNSISIELNGMCDSDQSLVEVSLPSVDSYTWSNQWSVPFYNCAALESILVPSSPSGGVISISNGYLFDRTEGANPNNTKIIVPDALVADYKAATNWSLFADYIVGQSESNG